MSDTPSAPTRYTLPAILFHWTSFALIVFVGALGLSFDLFPRGGRLFWINIHAIAGLAILAIAFMRIAWRTRHAPPAYPAETPELTKRLSHPVHMLLYALMIVLPMIGFIAFVWHARVFDFGLFKVDLGVASDKLVFGPAEKIHALLAYGLFGLAGLHGLAALWHRFARKDGLMERMWPG